MKAIDRLYDYFDFKGIRPTRFEKENGLSNGYFSITLRRKADIGSSIIETIINNCRDLNLDWLVTGKGSMLNDGEPIIVAEEPNHDYKNKSSCAICEEKEKVIANQAERIQELKETISILKGK